MEEECRRHAILDASNDCDDEIVSEWEAGLPDLDELMPLSQSLIPDDLASAFSVPPEPYRSQNDVARAFEETISTLRLAGSLSPFQPNNNGNDSHQTRTPQPQPQPDTATATMLLIDKDVGTDPRNSRRMDTAEESDSAPRTDNSAEDQSSARALKRPRLVWTPQLHKRFVEVVSHLGINNAVPKTIMQMMNVDGLTRENVASHLQKYRLYLKRQSREGPALSDQIFSSEPYPHQLRQQQQQQPRPVIPMVNTSSYHPFDSHHHFNIIQQHQQRDWSSANNYASLASPAND